ncbi:MAG: hypothetical protein ACYCU0_01850, partial [Solirubrobacteraceae bacterium]
PALPALLASPIGAGIPKIAGHYTAGNTLTCGTGKWAGNEPGANYYAAPQSYAYQWSLNGTPIPGATSAAYAPPSEGSYTCASTASNAAGASTQTSVAIKVKSLPPAASISSPASGGVYQQGAAVPTSFACAEGAGGPGLASCTDSNNANAPGGQLSTATLGAHTYAVTAISKNGKRASASISYTVVAPPPKPTPPPTPPQIAIRLFKAPVRHGRTLILLGCKGGTHCEGTLSLTARVVRVVKGHRRTRLILLARKHYSMQPNVRRDVPVPVARNALRVLAAATHRKLRVKVRVTVTGGATKHRAVLLRLQR